MMMYFPPGFDRRKAIELAELVNQAYAQLAAFKKGEQWKLAGGYSLVAALQYPGGESAALRSSAGRLDLELRESLKSRLGSAAGLPIGFIARRGSELFVVFRGTMTTSEWLKDLSIRLTPYDHGAAGNVHEGFLQTYGIFRGPVHAALGGVKATGRLFIAGHSLGAGLATLCAPDVVSNTGFKSPFVYTYGSPRVGDRRFASEYNRLLAARSFRIANTSDIVPAVPFPTPLLGFLGGYFTHVETPVDFTAQEEDSEKNHHMNTYMGALKAAAAKGGLFRSLFGRPPA